MYCVTKVTPIHFIDGEMESCSIGYYMCPLYEMLLMSILGQIWAHTCTDTRMDGHRHRQTGHILLTLLSITPSIIYGQTDRHTHTHTHQLPRKIKRQLAGKDD